MQAADGKAAASTPCDEDNDVCTVDACDGSGACVFGSTLNCSDGVACTQDSCDPQDGCQYSGTPANTCASATKAILKLKNSSSNSGDLVILVVTPITSRSTSLAPRRMMSMWPSVIGSKVPG